MARALTTLLLAVALAGCGDSADTGAGGPVRVQVWGDAEELALYRDLVSEYEKETGEEVQLVEVPDREGHLARLATSFAGGRPPDAFLINYRNFAGYAARGVLDPVGGRLGERRDDYYEPPIEAFEYDGKLQCLPQNASSLVVYFNRDLFEKAGLPDPDPGWSFDEFLRVAQRLTPGGGDRDPPPETYGLGMDPEVVRVAPFLWASGGDLVDNPDHPTRFTLDTPGSMRGLQNFLSLYGYRVVPTEQQEESESHEDRFARGGLGMFLGSRRSVPGFRESAKFDWDVAPLPRDRAEATVLHSDAWCLAEGKGADRAWDFVSWAAGPEGQRLLARGGRIVPSLRAVAESPDFSGSSERPRSNQVFLDGIEHMRRLPVAAAWPEIEDAASLALRRAYFNELSVEEAIERIREETEPLFGLDTE